MPIITVQFIKDVVATPEQKRELLIRLTNVFVSITGEVTRPFVYCIIRETPQAEWAIAGVPMPDLVYLTSEKHAGVIERSNDIMRSVVAQVQAQQQPQQQQAEAAVATRASKDEQADLVWRGAAATTNGNGHPETAQEADDIWRGKATPNGNGSAASADPVYRDREAERKSAAELDTLYIKRNREVVHRFYQAVNSGNRDVFKEIVHPNFVNHGGAAGDIVGPQALIDSLDPFYAAMPDWHVSEDFVVAQGDRVASRGTITGTHLGPFMGAQPTGKKVSWTGIIIYRLDQDGKIIERWQDFDAMGMLQQLGVIPFPQGR